MVHAVQQLTVTDLGQLTSEWSGAHRVDSGDLRDESFVLDAVPDPGARVAWMRHCASVASETYKMS